MAEKSGVAQADLAGIADEQVQPQHHDRMDGDQVGQAKIVGVAFQQRPDQQQQGEGQNGQPGAVQVEKVKNIVFGCQHGGSADGQSITR